MKPLAQAGLDKARDEYVYREDEHAQRDLEIETAFWLAVEECALCGPSLCTTHYDRLVNCL